MPAHNDPSLSRTDWSLLGHLHSGDQARESDALDRLIRRYWPAVYAFIRRTGRDVHASADLTQAFVADVLIGRRLMHEADRNRGRFRSFLMQSLRNFLHEQHRHATRAKRAPSTQAIVALEEQRVPGDASAEGSPEEAFDAAWCRELIMRVLRTVSDACKRDGLEDHWAVFDARVVQPMLTGAVPPDNTILAARLDLPSAVHASNLLVTVKRRFAQALRKEISRTVRNPADVDDELRELLGFLGRRK